jgi:DMSO/TMAO reductase YedYZ heme-binding membrane subunit
MRSGRLWGGFFLAIGLNMFAIAFYLLCYLFITSRLSVGDPNSAFWKAVHNVVVLLLFGFGFSQALHIIPIALRFRQRGEFERMKGLLIGAALTALLCGSCFIIVFPTLSPYLIRR